MCASYVGDEGALPISASTVVQDSSFMEKMMDLIYTVNTGDGLLTSSVIADEQDVLDGLRYEQHGQGTVLLPGKAVVLDPAVGTEDLVAVEDEEDDDDEEDDELYVEEVVPAGNGKLGVGDQELIFDPTMRPTPGTSNVFNAFDPMKRGNFPGFRYYGQQPHDDVDGASTSAVQQDFTTISDSVTVAEGTHGDNVDLHCTLRSSRPSLSNDSSDAVGPVTTSSFPATGGSTEAPNGATPAVASSPPHPTENYVARIDASVFQCRIGPNYSKRKEKAASAPAFMELMSADWVRTPKRVLDVGSKMNIPCEWYEGIDTHQPGVPPLFIVNGQIPHNWPSTLFQDPQDGPCMMLVLIFRMKPETCEMMKDLNSAPPAVQLYARFCAEAPECYMAEGKGNAELDPPQRPSQNVAGSSTSAPTTPMNTQQSHGPHNDNAASVSGVKSSINITPPPSSSGSSGTGRMSLVGGMGRFGMGGGKQGQPNPWSGRAKLQMRCENFDELGLPSFISNYNGKPVLIKESGSLIRGSNYVELVVNVKKFGMLAVNTLPTVLCRTVNAVLNIGFCIESREEEEMPEGIFGAMQVCKGSSDPTQMPMWFARPANQDAIEGSTSSGIVSSGAGSSSANHNRRK